MVGVTEVIVGCAATTVRPDSSTASPALVKPVRLKLPSVADAAAVTEIDAFVLVVPARTLAAKLVELKLTADNPSSLVPETDIFNTSPCWIRLGDSELMVGEFPTETTPELTT